MMRLRKFNRFRSRRNVRRRMYSKKRRNVSVIRWMPFSNIAKHCFVIEKHTSLPWLYGAGRETLTFEQIDILASKKENKHFTELWAFMYKQYKSYIINKVVFEISNLTIESRYQQCADARFSWDDTAKYPFSNDYYEHNTNSRECGQYMLVHRSRVEADGDLLLKNAIVAPNRKLYQHGSTKFFLLSSLYKR